MPINEQIVTGRKFRKLIDEASRLWLRISFWTKACDVEFDDGENAETKFSNTQVKINNLINSYNQITNSFNQIKESFQDGVNKIYNKLVGLGFTPETNSPDAINGAINKLYLDRYNDGITEGKKSADIFSNVKYYTWNPPTAQVPASSSANISSPTAKEMFGAGYGLVGISSFSNMRCEYGAISTLSFSDLGTENGRAYFTCINISDTDANISIYASVVFIGKKL